MATETAMHAAPSNSAGRGPRLAMLRPTHPWTVALTKKNTEIADETSAIDRPWTEVTA